MPIELVVSGPDPNQAADEVEEILRSLDPELRIERRTHEKSGDRDEKGIDPVAVAAVVLALPAAFIAALDLRDRIAKRKRASKLIDESKRLARTSGIRISIVSKSTTIQIDGTDADKLLELFDEAEPGDE